MAQEGSYRQSSRAGFDHFANVNLEVYTILLCSSSDCLPSRLAARKKRTQRFAWHGRHGALRRAAFPRACTTLR